MQQRPKRVVGNWKMNGGLASNAALLDALRSFGPGVATAVCVPFPYLAQASDALRGSTIELGAQDVSEYVDGAYTGEVAASMLADFGCRYVLVGHSERRTWFGDTDARVAAKVERAVAAGIVPIVCVGETLVEREQSRAEAVVSRQLDAVVDRVGSAGIAASVIAYEPVWAIGTGKTASPAEAQAMHAVIRAHVARVDPAVAASVAILYGGSVKASNAASLFAEADIDGGLIGGASLVAADFRGIVEAAGASGG